MFQRSKKYQPHKSFAHKDLSWIHIVHGWLSRMFQMFTADLLVVSLPLFHLYLFLLCVTLCFPHCKQLFLNNYYILNNWTNVSWAISKVFSCALWPIKEWIRQNSLLSRGLKSRMGKQIYNNHYDAQLGSSSRKDDGSNDIQFLKSRSTSVIKYFVFQTNYQYIE